MSDRPIEHKYTHGYSVFSSIRAELASAEQAAKYVRDSRFANLLVIICTGLCVTPSLNLSGGERELCL